MRRRRFTWSWADYWRHNPPTPEEREMPCGVATPLTAACGPERGGMPSGRPCCDVDVSSQNSPVGPCARPVLFVVPAGDDPPSAQMVRARELLEMGVALDLVRRCVRLSDRDLAQLIEERAA